MRDHSDENLIWGWVIPRGGKKKPVILDRANHDEISAICEEEIHGLGYFPVYTSVPPCDLTAERDRLREALIASRNTHAELAEFLLGDGGSSVKSDVLKGMFADLQRARLAADAALEQRS